MRVTERTIHGIVRGVLEEMLSGQANVPLRGTVVDTPAGRYAMVRIGQAAQPVPIWRPALPVTPQVGDEVSITRGEGGYLAIDKVLGRDPTPIVTDPDGGEQAEHDLTTHQSLGLLTLDDLSSHAGTASHLLTYTTPNTYDTEDGKWTRVAVGSIPQQFGSVAACVLINGQGSNGTTWTRGMVRFRVRQQADFGSDPSVTVELLEAADLAVADIAIVVTSNAGPTTFGLYIRLTREYEWATFTPLWTRPDRCEFEWTGCEAFAASLPSGTSTTATAVVTGAHTHAASGTGTTGGGATLSPTLLSGAGRLNLATLTPAQITADQNDYAPTGYTGFSLWSISSDAARNITGIVAPDAPVAGTLLILHNSGSFTITLVHGSASSSTNNRFLFTGSANESLLTNDTVVLLYTGSRWRKVA
jgi:hypothetical protein